jgi:hypothetical protein
MPQAPSKAPIGSLIHLFNHCLLLSLFPNTWKEAKVITLPKSGKDPKFQQILRPISLLSTTEKLFVKGISNFSKTYGRRHAQRKPVWLSCTSQHDIAMYEAGGSRDP